MHYQILQIEFISILWLTVGRITNEILGVKGLTWPYLVDWTLTPDRLTTLALIDINCSAATFWITDILIGFLVAVVVNCSEKEKLISFLSIGVMFSESCYN